MKLRNLTSDKTYLYNGRPVPPGAEFNDLTDPCAAVTELFVIKAENNLPSIYEMLTKDYQDFILTCSLLQTNPTQLIPAQPEADPNPSDALPADNAEESPGSLGRNFVFPELELGHIDSEEFSPEPDMSIDPNIPPPQEPAAGEAEERSNDEEREKADGAEPVNLFTGEFYLQKIDFELPSIGFPFVFTRTYKSGRRYFGPFGYNWDHNYNIYLRQLTNGSIAVNSGALQEDIYSDSGDAILYNAPRGLFSILERQQGLALYDFVITFKGGLQYFFAKPAGWSHPEKVPLIKIQDANGNFQELVYNDANQLVTVIDTAHRRINFIYGECNLLEALQPEFLQETGQPPVEIKYMHANNIEQLSAVINLPTPDFPNGLITSYEYDDTQARPELRNNILRIIDPKGQVVVENFYGTETTDDSYNRVVKQYFMGGEYSFRYTSIRNLPPFDDYINDAYLQTELYEPARPLKVYTFNFRGNLLDERFRLISDGSYRVWSQSYRYNKQGKLVKLFYANGMADNYLYDDTNPDPLAQGNLLQIDRQSQPLRLLSKTINKFTYEPLFQKQKLVEDEDGNITEYIYDYEINPLIQNGNLVQKKYPDATLPDGSIQNNCIESYSYDLFGQVIERLSPEKRKQSFEYYLSGNGAGLVKKTIRHDSVSSLVQSIEYDAMGFQKRVIDGGGNDSLYFFNLAGQLIKTELPPVNGNRAVYKYEYNEDGKIAKEYLPKGSYQDAVLNDNFLINEYSYDLRGWLAEIIKYSNTEYPQRTRFGRDIFGNVIKLINPRGQEFKYKFDDRNLLLEETQFSNTSHPLKIKYRYDRIGNIAQSTFPDGNTELFDYDEPFSRLFSHTNHLGVKTENTYGTRDKINKVVIMDAGGVILQTHQYGFDEKGRPIKADVNSLITTTVYDMDNLTTLITNHRNSDTIFNYDGVGRVIKITDPLGNSQENVFDNAGNAIQQKANSLSAAGNVSTIVYQTSYDSRGRPVQFTDPLGNIISNVFDDRNFRTAVTNAIGHRVNTYYDTNGQPVKTSIIRNGVEATINRWQRDLLGRLISYQDTENNLTSYFYDDRDNLTKIEYPDLSVFTQQYDSLNFLATVTDCNGTKSNLTYNNLGQNTRIDFQEAAPALATPSVKFGFDSFGRRNIITRGAHTITRTFDAFNRITEERQGIESVKRQVDDLNGIISVHYPDNRIDTYTHDEIGRISEVLFKKKGVANCIINDFPEGTVLSKYEYDGVFLQTKKYSNGAITNYNYNVEGGFSSFTTLDKNGAKFDSEAYLYDGEKRKRAVVRDGLPNHSRLFNYDEMNRFTECFAGINILIPANLNTQLSIDNVIAGVNVLAATGHEKYNLTDNDKRRDWILDNIQFTPVHNNLLQTNALSGTDGTNIQYAYDKNGNRIADDQYKYYYDALDNLIKVIRKSDQATVLEHIYDGTGRIIERKLNQVSRKFIYDGLRSIHEIFQNGTILQNCFGIGLDDCIVQSNAAVNYFCHSNDVQSLNCLTDKSGTPVQYFAFNSFGNPFVFDAAKNQIPVSNSVADIIFAGRPYIPSIDKYDFRKRLYDPKTGLFFQRDIMNYAESSNQYLYCQHDPVNRMDVTGGCSKTNDSDKERLEAQKKEYMKGLLLQQLITNGTMVWHAVNPQAAARALAENVVVSMGQYFGSEKGSDAELQGFDNLNSLNPFYNVARGGAGILEMSERDQQSYSFDQGMEDANTTNRFASGVLGVVGILSGAKMIGSRLFGAPRIAPPVIVREPPVIKTWSVKKGEGLYGPFYRSDSADIILNNIIPEGRLLGATARSPGGLTSLYPGVNAIEGLMPADFQGTQFRTFIKPNQTGVKFVQFDEPNGVKWTTENPQIKSIYKDHYLLGPDTEHAVLPIMIDKVQIKGK